MEVRFYKYSGRDNVGHKAQFFSNATNSSGNDVGVMNITTYGEITPLTMSFYLDEKLDTNYCYYKFNGITYYAYVSVEVRTRGDYIYRATVDPLTTAYEAGCMNSSQFVEYSSSGMYGTSATDSPALNNKGFIVDTRIPFEDSVYHIELINNAYKIYDYYIAVVINTGAITAKNAPAPETFNCTPGTGTYLLTPEQYTKFCYDFWDIGGIDDPGEEITDPNLQSKLSKCILHVFAIPTCDIPNSAFAYTSNGINLFIVEDIIAGINSTLRTYTVSSDMSVYFIASDSGTMVKSYQFSNLTMFENIDEKIMLADYDMYIPGLGNLSFNFAQVCGSHNVYGTTNFDAIKMGFNIYIDFTSGARRAVLTIGGKPRYGVFVENQYPCFMPLMVFEDNGDYFNIIANAIGNVATSGWVGSAVEGVKLGSNLIRESYKSNTTVRGSTGGTVEHNVRAPATLYVFTHLQWGKNSFQNIYGKPCFQMRNITYSHTVNTGSGYIKTRNCKLPYKGLPHEIVDAASLMCDEGVFLGKTNSPE